MLGTGRDRTFNGSMGALGFPFRRTHFRGVALVVKEDVRVHPMEVGLFGTHGIRVEAETVAGAVEPLFLGHAV